MRLPEMPYAGNIGATRQNAWGGLNHTPGAQGGEIYDMENLTSDLSPLLATRERRYTVGTLTAPNGLYVSDKRYTVDGSALYADGAFAATLPSGGEKIMAALGKRLVIFPDKVVYTQESGLSALASTASGVSCRIQDGEYAGESAEANTIYASGVDWSNYFKAGDGVTISGAVAHPENNRTSIIREISGSYLRFYENTFTIGEGGDAETLTIKRDVPDLDYICVNENRVWGCKGDTIWCSKLGDPFNWYVFDGISTDAWSVESGTPGEFTACCSYLGYPVFFKESKIFKVYGNRPQNYELMSSATLGVSPGSHKSLAVAGETLYYLSRAGIVAYSGGLPHSISDAFGQERFSNAVGGSDGMKYYVSMQDSSGTYALYVYDTNFGTWHKEDKTRVLHFAYDNGMYALTESGALLRLWGQSIPDGAAAEGSVSWMAEFGDFTMGSFSGKYPVRLRLRFEGEAGAAITAAIRYNSAGNWQEVSELITDAKRAVYLALPIKRCDHFRLKLSGTGAARLYDWEFETYSENYTRK